LFSASAEAN